MNDIKNDINLREAVSRREQKLPPMSADLNERVRSSLSQTPSRSRLGLLSHGKGRWVSLFGALAASILLLLVFRMGQKPVEEKPVVAERVEQNFPKPTPQPVVEEKQEEALAEVQPTEKPVKKQRPVQINKEQQLANAETPSVDSVDYYIARLEAEMAALDDSVSTAQLEKLINADARLRQLVNRIINGEVEQVQNILKPDSTEEYLNF